MAKVIKNQFVHELSFPVYKVVHDIIKMLQKRRYNLFLIKQGLNIILQPKHWKVINIWIRWKNFSISFPSQILTTIAMPFRSEQELAAEGGGVGDGRRARLTDVNHRRRQFERSARHLVDSETLLHCVATTSLGGILTCHIIKQQPKTPHQLKKI